MLLLFPSLMIAAFTDGTGWMFSPRCTREQLKRSYLRLGLPRLDAAGLRLLIAATRSTRLTTLRRNLKSGIRENAPARDCPSRVPRNSRNMWGFDPRQCRQVPSLRARLRKSRPPGPRGFFRSAGAARADPVHALFVFLNLLEGQVEVAAEGLLRHVNLDAPHPDAASYIDVDRIGWLCRHNLAPQVHDA